MGNEVICFLHFVVGQDRPSAIGFDFLLSFDILLTVHLNIFILILTNLMH